MLAAIFAWHPLIVPRWPGLDLYKTANEFFADQISPIGRAMKDGKQLPSFGSFAERLNSSKLNRDRIECDCTEKRFLWKEPALSWSIDRLYAKWPDAKVIALYRSGPANLSSQYLRWLTTSREEGLIQQLTYRCRMWNDLLEYCERARKKYHFPAITYEQLTTTTTEIITSLFNYCELPIEQYALELKLRPWNPFIWQDRIPKKHWQLVIDLTAPGQQVIDKLNENNYG